MDSTGARRLLAVTAGLLGAVQVAVMGKLGERIGSLEAVIVAAIVTGVIILPVAASSHGRASAGSARRSPSRGGC